MDREHPDFIDINLLNYLQAKNKGMNNREYPLDDSLGLPYPKNKVLDRYSRCYVTGASHVTTRNNQGYCIECLHYITEY